METSPLILNLGLPLLFQTASYVLFYSFVTKNYKKLRKSNVRGQKIPQFKQKCLTI